MQKHSNSQPSDATDTQAPAVAVSLSTEAQARRRLLVKGLGKGAAVVAVVTPIHTLAGPVIVGGGKLCTVSGVQSNVGSPRTGAATSTCSGYTPGHFATLSNWPGYNAGTATATNTVDGITFTQATAFNAVFGGADTTPLLTLVTASPASNNAAWVTALLNAIQNPAGFNFPYTASQVRAYFLDPNPANVQKALDFFKGYMQTVA